MISPREPLRAVYEVAGGRELPAGRDSGFGMWVQEISWRDFYQHVLAAWPRVCMKKPFNLKYDGTIEWATDDDGAKLQAWKDGKTGFPIVDAAMRSLKTQGCAPAYFRWGASLSSNGTDLARSRRHAQPLSHDCRVVPLKGPSHRLARG